MTSDRNRAMSDPDARVAGPGRDVGANAGYNGFSYRDLAEQIGIKTASIHYHFPTKGDLGEALIENEREVFARNLAPTRRRGKGPASPDWSDSSRLFQATTIGRNRMCLGAMLAVEQETLPDAVEQAVRRLFADNEDWLAKLLEEGESGGNSGSKDPPTWPPGPVLVARRGLADRQGLPRYRPVRGHLPMDPRDPDRLTFFFWPRLPT